MHSPEIHKNMKAEWVTPRAFVRELEAALRIRFVLDVAATRENTVAMRYHSLAEGRDGLERPWIAQEPEAVWCNPPYGRGISRWCERAIACGSPCVMLLPANTDTAWFHECVLHEAALWFPRGRITFSGVPGNPGGSVIALYHFARWPRSSSYKLQRHLDALVKARKDPSS